MRARQLATALRQPAPEVHRCSVMRCNAVAEAGAPGEPRAFCPTHWRFLKPWQRSTLLSTFADKEWDGYFEAVRQFADDLDCAEQKARDAGFAGLVLARFFEPGCTDGRRGKVVRLMGSPVK